MLHDVCDNLKTAVEMGRTDIVKSTLDACHEDSPGNNPEKPTKKKLLNEPFTEVGTFLALATKLNHCDVVRALLSEGADPSIKNEQGLNSFDYAKSDEMVQVYAKELLQATGNCRIDRMTSVINSGVDVNCWDSKSEQNTPLHWAACYGNKATVNCLIKAGANVNATNAYGTTPLHDAVNRGNAEIVEELLRHGADPLKLDKATNPKSPFDLAAIRSPQLLPIFQQFSADLSPSQSKMVNGGNSVEKLMRSASLDSYQLDSLGSRQNGDECSSPVGGLLMPQFGHVLDRVAQQNPIKPLVTEPVFHLLWPQPQSLTELKGAPFVPDSALHVSVMQSSHHSIHRVLDVWDRARPAFLALNLNVTVKDVQPYSGIKTDAQIECIINSHLFSLSNAYKIHISSHKITVSCESLSSLHYALSTLTQLFQLAARLSNVISLSPALIYDYPSVKHRAVLLDISPSSRVPSMDYLLDIIDKWSWLKVSHLHLYSRLSPSSAWPLCFKQSELLSIDRYCQDRFISLVPVLEVEATVKKTDLKNMWSLFQQVIVVFTNVEYIHIGPTLSHLLVGEESMVSISEIWHILGIPSNITLMICGNSLHNYSACDDLQLNNIILVQYGFQADYDFLDWTREFFEKGCSLCFSPGTCSWNSLVGCPEASICNIYRAIQSTKINPTVGIIVAQWSGQFHLTPYLFSWPGFLVGAGLSWNADTHLDFVKSRLAALLDTHIFNDESMIIGQCILELGHIETMALRFSRAQEPDDISDLPPTNGSFLYRLIMDPDNVSLEALSTDVFNKLTRLIKKVQNEIYRTKLECQNSEMVIQELQVSVDLMLCACKIGRALVSMGVNPNSNMGLAVINLGISNLPPTLRTDIANKLLALIEQYKGIWLQRHVPAGLKNSLLVLSTALRRFVPEPQF